jgi:hypothetical protein
MNLRVKSLMKLMKSTLGASVLACAGGLTSAAQAPPAGQTAPPAPWIASPAPSPRSSAAGTIVREIDDPSNGDRWLLVRDPERPGAPGRLILPSAQPGSAAQSALAGLASPVPVIHTGDRLTVEQNTSLVRARLEAVALSAALLGSPLKVRLVPGGAVMLAVALGPGRAAFAPDTGRRP